MFLLNKTADWPNSLPPKRKEMYIDQSRKERRTTRQNNKERWCAIQEKRIETLREKRQQIIKKEADQYK